jgi:hypothetical protein
MKKIVSIVVWELTFIVSCNVSNNKIATIKNNTSNTVACAILENGIMTDSLLYSDTSYMSYLIQPQMYDTYMVADSNLINAPDSAERHIYILRLDSLNKYRNKKLKDGILKNSLIKKIDIQLNKVMEPIDTVYVR